MLNELLLLSGNDIPIEEIHLLLHQPTIKEIALIGEDKFFSGCEFLRFTKEKLSSEDRNRLENISNFEIIMSIMREKNPSAKRNTVSAQMVLSLLFPTYEIHYNFENMSIDKNKHLREVLDSDKMHHVQDFVDKVNRGPGNLNTAAQCLLMDTQSVVTLAAERGNQGRMDVENPVRPGGRKSLAEDSHEACQDDEVDPALLKQKIQICFKGGAFQHGGLYTGSGSTFQRKSFGVIGYDEHNLAAAKDTGLFCIQKRLEIGPAAGNQNGDFRFFCHPDALM